VTCYVSMDGTRYREIQTPRVDEDQRAEDVTRTFTFTWTMPGIRHVKIHVEGTKLLPDWHASAGGMSWVFVDELGVRQAAPTTPPASAAQALFDRYGVRGTSRFL